MWQETVGTLEITGHFLCHSMLLYVFIWLVLIRFLLIKNRKKQKEGKTEHLWLFWLTKAPCRILDFRLTLTLNIYITFLKCCFPCKNHNLSLLHW